MAGEALTTLCVQVTFLRIISIVDNINFFCSRGTMIQPIAPQVPMDPSYKKTCPDASFTATQTTWIALE